MLNVSYKEEDRIGFYTIHQDGKDFRIDICRSNSLWAEIYFYKDDKGKDMVQLYSFMSDIEHLKNCIKNKCLPDTSKITFYKDKVAANKDIQKAVVLIATKTNIETAIINRQ